MIGNLRKMAVEAAEPVRYHLPVGEERVSLNPLIGGPIRLHFTGDIHCIACGRKTKKSFSQGYCFPCTQRLAECDLCIVRPEKCHYDQGTCREPDWGRDHCLQPHYVYLANSSGLKVGITRGTQIPTRWIDQGATQGLPIFKVATRYQAGLIETALKAHVSDRTDWRRMLKGAAEPVDVAAERERLLAAAEADLAPVRERFGDAIEAVDTEPVTELAYPVDQYPEKVKSLNLDKTPTLEDTLRGIKGQYWILDSGVINIRKYAGYHVEFSA